MEKVWETVIATVCHTNGEGVSAAMAWGVRDVVGEREGLMSEAWPLTLALIVSTTPLMSTHDSWY